MKATSAFAIYFVIWWLMLFLVLPFGIRSHDESGTPVEDGHDAGAPVNPMLLRKALITTLLATLVFAIVYGVISQGWIGFDDIPWLRDMPGR